MATPAPTGTPANNFVLDVGVITQAPVFDVRNGQPGLARSIYVRPTIPQGYHWVPIDNLPLEDAMTYVGLYIRSCWAMLSVHGGVTGTTTPAQLRKAAIVIGTARAVATAYYRVATADLIPGELAVPIYHYEPPSATSPDVAITHMQGVGQNLLAEADGMAVLTEEEKNVIAVMLPSSIGILPLHGYSLLMTGHHYISDVASQSMKAFLAVEKQFWSIQNVRTWVTNDRDSIRDSLWHKACHPVQLSLKYELCRRGEVIEMLLTAGVGSAAARLPAMEPEMRAAGSMKALITAVTPIFLEFGGDIATGPLDEAIAAVELFPLGAGGARAALPTSVPQGLADRREAVSYLKKVMDTNAGNVAIIYGFHEAMLEHAAMGGTGQNRNSLSQAWSLRKLESAFGGPYHAGVEYFKDYIAARNAARATGVFKAPTLGLTIA